MKAVTTCGTLLTLAGTLLAPQLAQAQELKAGSSSQFRITNLRATSPSIRLRIGSGEKAAYVDTGQVTIGGDCVGSFDLATGRGTATWNVTVDAPGLKEAGIGTLRLRSGGPILFDRERNELFMVDVVAPSGGGTAAMPCQCGGSCCNNINKLASRQKDGEGKVDWGRGIGGEVVFSSVNAGDLGTYPFEEMLRQAVQAAGLSLTGGHLSAIVAQYRKDPRELVIYHPETGEAVSSSLRGGGTVVFGSR